MASFSLSLASGPKTRKSSPSPRRNGVKRAHASLEDADSEEEELNVGKRQNVTHFDVSAGGAVDVSDPKVVKEALVIKSQANRDWKQASVRSKRQKYGLPSEEDERAKQNFVAPVPSTSFGLNVHKSGEECQSTDAAANLINDYKSIRGPVIEGSSLKIQTDDERAIAALTGVKQESTLTIPAVTEEEALERDVQYAPDAPTLAEYAAVPVEEFGAAMLRGMGWKEGQGIGNQKGQKTVKAKIPERRPALLGIGAKPDAAVAAELGAWGAGAKGRRKVDIIYNPLVLKNANTGERLTEEELKLKLQEQKEREADKRLVRDTDRGHRGRESSSRDNHRTEDNLRERNERRREQRRGGNDYDDSRPRSTRDRSPLVDKRRSGRDGSTSYDKHREKRRDRDYYRDRDERQEKETRREHDDRKRDHGKHNDDRDRRYKH